MENSSRQCHRGSTLDPNKRNSQSRFSRKNAPILRHGSKHKPHPHSIFDLLEQSSLALEHSKAYNEAKQKSREKAVSFVQLFHRLVARHFSCPICQCIATEPVALACSHLFCRECLDEWVHVLETKGEMKSCPVCRHLIHVENHLLKHSILPPNYSLSLFFTKVAGLQKFFRQHQEKSEGTGKLESSQMAVLLRLLDIPYNFRSVESMHNLSTVYNHHIKFRNSETPKLVRTRKSDFCHIIGQLTIARDSILSTHIYIAPTKWQLLQDRFVRMIQMICPQPVQALAQLIFEYIVIIPMTLCNHRWIWVKPKSEFYYWLFFSLVFWYLVWTFGSTVLHIPSIRTPVKRLIEHALFICFDGPTYELANVIHEAFMAPI